MIIHTAVVESVTGDLGAAGCLPDTLLWTEAAGLRGALG